MNKKTNFIRLIIVGILCILPRAIAADPWEPARKIAHEINNKVLPSVALNNTCNKYKKILIDDVNNILILQVEKHGSIAIFPSNNDAFFFRCDYIAMSTPILMKDSENKQITWNKAIIIESPSVASDFYIINLYRVNSDVIDSLKLNTKNIGQIVSWKFK